MGINIIAGKCSKDNLSNIFSLLRNRDKSKNHYVIAPDRCLFSIERELFDELEESCFFDVSVMSFSKLSKKVISNTNKNILTKQSGVALVKKLLIENKDKLHTFGNATNFIGFASTLFETICLFKSCNISCDEIYVSDSKDYSNLKQKDIKLIYSKYEEFLKNDYTDSFNQLKLVADSIKNDTFKNTDFYFVEFDDFTALMYLIISKIAKFNNIHICTTYGKDNINSNIYTNKVYYDLIDLCKYNGIDYTIQKIENNDILVNNLLAYIPNKIKKQIDNITITSFDEKSDEIKYTVAQIYSKIQKDSNLNLGDFAVVLPSISDYKDLIENEFHKYDIPYYLDVNEKLCDQILIRLIFDICKLFDGKFLASDILNIIKNSYFNFALEDICDYDNYLKKLNLRGFSCLDLESSQNEELQNFFKKINSWIGMSKEYTKVAEFYEIIADIYNFLLTFEDKYICNLNPLDLRIFEQVKNKFESIEKDYISVFGNESVKFDEFLETYSSYFESSDISLPPITSNTLFVADFETSYISKYKYVYILGCNEGKLPNFKVDNGLISDEEIAKLPNAKQINPTINLLNSRKTFKLFELMFKASEHTYISFNLSSNDGKAYPNSLIKSLINIYDMPIVNGSNELDFVANNLISMNLDNVAFNNLSKDIIIDNILTLTKNWKIYSKYPNYRQLLSLLVHLIDDKNILKLIDNESLLNEKIKLKNSSFFENKTTSISQIETYYNCPYKHFARYGLKIDRGKTYKLKPNDIGTIIHSILKKLMPNILASRDIDKLGKMAEDYLDKILLTDEYIYFAKNPMNNYIIIALKKELHRIIEGIICQICVSSYIPNVKYLEYSFVCDGLSKHGIKIKGMIDRVDTWDNNFIIIDYKTGDSNFDNYTDVYSGKKLQLLVYARAFQNISKLHPKGAFYLPISNSYSTTKQTYKLIGVLDNDINNIYAMDNKLTEVGYSSNVINLRTTQSGEFYKNSAFYSRMCINNDDFNYLLDFAIEQVDIAIKNIIDGDITPMPLRVANKNSCEYCEYIGLCNYCKDNDRVIENVTTVEDLKNKGEKVNGI